MLKKLILEGCGCGCNDCDDKSKSIFEYSGAITELSEGLRYHLENNIPLYENIYRPESNEFFKLFRESRSLYKKGKLSNLNEIDLDILENTLLGEIGEYKGKKVPLDYPIHFSQIVSEAEYNGKDVELNKPKRGGSKKFYVYWKNPKTGRVKKISFGMAGGGLRAKLNNPKARRAFSKRMDCPNSKPGTPKYYACRLPRYANLLGFKTNFTGFW